MNLWVLGARLVGLPSLCCAAAAPQPIHLPLDGVSFCLPNPLSLSAVALLALPIVFNAISGGREFFSLCAAFARDF